VLKGSDMRRPSLYSNSRVYNLTQYLCERNAHNLYTEYGNDNSVRVTVFKTTNDKKSISYKFTKNERGYTYESRKYDTETFAWKLEAIGAVELEDMIREFCDASE